MNFCQFPAHDHLMRTIELSRVNLFNVVTQYRATFSDDDANDSDENGNIFHAWINEKVNDFINTVDHDLSQGITSFDTLLGQCMYFGLSFSRVGADFRCLLVPIFTKHISKHFKISMNKVTDQFERDMENYTFINKLTINTFVTSARTEANSLAPPETLLNFQPLAFYCNGVLTILNEIQHCAPVALASDVAIILEKSLIKISNNILKFFRQEQQALGAKERDNFIKFCCAFAYELVPYLQRCIQEIFPVNLLTVQLGINTATFQKEGITQVRKLKILEPLESLLPDKIDVIIKKSSEMKITENIQPSEPSSEDVKTTNYENAE